MQRLFDIRDLEALKDGEYAMGLVEVVVNGKCVSRPYDKRELTYLY
jgi:hypothetical protein